MNRSYKIAPSILSANFARLGDEVRAVEAAGADLIHFDVMDGHFVRNLSMGLPILESVRKITTLPIDAHLMIEHPERYVEAFVKAGADSISVHAEAVANLRAMAERVRELGARASVAVSPETHPGRVLEVADYLDMILVMGVHPGIGGQGLIPATLDKLRDIREELDRHALHVDLEIDGGVTVNNIAEVAAAGANVFVSGSAIFGRGDYREIISEMRHRIGSCEAAV